MTSTKRNAHTLSLEDAFFDKPQEGESNWPSPIPQLLYVLRLVETFWLFLLCFILKHFSVFKLQFQYTVYEQMKLIKVTLTLVTPYLFQNF